MLLSPTIEIAKKKATVGFLIGTASSVVGLMSLFVREYDLCPEGLLWPAQMCFASIPLIAISYGLVSEAEKKLAPKDTPYFVFTAFTRTLIIITLLIWGISLGTDFWSGELFGSPHPRYLDTCRPFP